MKTMRTENKTILHETPAKSRVEQHLFVKEDLRRKIAKKAYELYEGRGAGPGRDIEDWLQAERLVTPKDS